MGRIFGTKSGPGNKGKDGGLQEPNGIFLFIFVFSGGGDDQSIIQGLCNNRKFVKLALVDEDPSHQGKEMYQFMTDTLRTMRHGEDFNLFFGVFKNAANPIKLVGKPTLPRRQKKPNYSILQIVIGYDGPESNAYHPETAHDYFKLICF